MIRNTISHFLKKQHELYPSYVGTDAFDLDKYRRVMYEPYREEVRKEDTAKGKKTEELVLSQNLKLSAEAGNILLISDEDYAVTFTAGNILRMGSSFVVNDPGGRILESVQDKLIGYEIVPLRYNNDKQKKPLFSRGLSVCRLLFNSFSKLKIDENYKEKRRLFY